MCSTYSLVSWYFSLTVLKEINNLPRLPWIFIGNWAAACYNCHWSYPAADAISEGWIRVAADSILWPTRSKFKELFCKIHLFLFSTAWFQLPLIQALAAASRTLKQLEEAWGSFKTLAAIDSSCSGSFEQRRLTRDLRLIDYFQNFDPEFCLTKKRFLILTQVNKFCYLDTNKKVFLSNQNLPLWHVILSLWRACTLSYSLLSAAELRDGI